MSQVKTYKTINGHSYDPETPDEIITILERVAKSHTTIRIWHGDQKTGKATLDENDIEGRVGFSMGPIKVPLLVPNGDDGGPALSTGFIVKIVTHHTKKTVLYENELFHLPKLTIKPSECATDKRLKWEVCADGEEVARFRRADRAEAWVKYMLGEISRPAFLREAPEHPDPKRVGEAAHEVTTVLQKIDTIINNGAGWSPSQIAALEKEISDAMDHAYAVGLGREEP